ncbi:hypothetical protein GW17_00019215 [Ensete ventricosum]|nr:hypothetical protein GW17_00019215 [Ensete ventricosum]
MGTCVDKASILGEEDGDGPLERGARQREVSVRAEVAKHIRDTENKEVEEGTDGRGSDGARLWHSNRCAAAQLWSPDKGDSGQLRTLNRCGEFLALDPRWQAQRPKEVMGTETVITGQGNTIVCRTQVHSKGSLWEKESGDTEISSIREESSHDDPLRGAMALRDLLH